MTNPAPSQPANPSTPAAQAPAGVRIASTLAWVVGILTILIAFAIGIPAISSGAGLLFIVINSEGSVCCYCLSLGPYRQWLLSSNISPSADLSCCLWLYSLQALIGSIFDEPLSNKRLKLVARVGY